MANGSRFSRFDSRLPNLAGLLAWTLALWTILTTLAAVVAANCDLPYSDEWDTWMTWLRQGYSAAWLFAQHNDHRIVTTRLLFVIDNLAFHGRVWFPQAVSLAVQAALMWLLWKLARRAGVADPQDNRVLGAAIACCLFSAQQSINFIWGFQVQFILVYATGAAALAALLCAAETESRARRGAWMAACLLLGAACSYSMANGILIWPILLLAAAWLRVGRSTLGVLAASGPLVGVFYFHGWHTSPLDAPAPLWRVAWFAMAHAGGPIAPLVRALGGDSSTIGIAAALIGGTLLVYAAVQWILMWTRRGQYSGAQVVLLHFALFVAAASFAIAAGRAHLQLADAFRSRYITPPYILWACLLAVAWPQLRGVAPHAIRWAAVAALLVGIVPYQAAKLRDARVLGAAFNRTAVALVVGVNDPVMWPYLDRPVTDSAPAVEYLKSHRLTIFHHDWTHWPGLPLAARFSVDAGASACQGAFQEAASVDDPARPGWRVSGWARNASGGGPDLIVLGDSSGHIAGVALAISGEWAGYARPGSPALTAYAVEPNGNTLCFLETRNLSPR